MRVNPVKEPRPPPAGPIVLSVNAVIDGRFFRAGEPVPYADEKAVPDPLKPFITAAEPDDEPEGAPGIRFQQGIIYRTDAQGHIITKTGRRRAAELAHEAAVQAAAEAAAEDAQVLPDGVAEALQAEHDIRIGIALKTAELAAEQRDRAPELIRAAQDEEDGVVGESGTAAAIPAECPGTGASFSFDAVPLGGEPRRQHCARAKACLRGNPTASG